MTRFFIHLHWLVAQIHCFTRWGITLATGTGIGDNSFCPAIVVVGVAAVIVGILVFLQVIQVVEYLGANATLVAFHGNPVLPDDNGLSVCKNGEVERLVLDLGGRGVVVTHVLINWFGGILHWGLCLGYAYLVNLDSVNAQVLKQVKLDTYVESASVTFEGVVVRLVTLFVILKFAGIVGGIRAFHAIVTIFRPIIVSFHAQIFCSAVGRKHGMSIGR